MLICALLMVQSGIAQRATIAAWTFPYAAGTVSTYDADCQSGTLYADGTHGSSEWTITTGTGVNNSISFNTGGYAPSAALCDDATSGKALGVGGNGSNGYSVVFEIHTTGFQDIMVAYDVRPTSTGPKTVVWAYSTDGVNYTDQETLNYGEDGLNLTNNSYHSLSVDFSSVADINGQETVYIRATFDGATNATGNNRYDNIHFTGVPNIPTTMQPVFSVTGGNFCIPFDVEMTCGTENASIYYTTDGSTPDNVNGTLYTEALHIAATTNLRAVAYADGLATSFETSATYNFPTEIATVSEFKAIGGDNANYKLTCPLTAVFQSGSYLFVEDEAHTGLCLYGSSMPTFANGEVITDGICGINKVYYGLIEMQNPTFVNTTPTAGTPVEPVTVSMATLRINWNTYDSRLITINNVTFEEGTFSGGSNSVLKMYQANDSIDCANTFGNLTNYTAPISLANATGFAINNTAGRRFAPRNTDDIVNLLPTLTIAAPTEGQIFEQGNAVYVDLETSNFNFENGSMIEGQLLINGQSVTTQYLHSAMELSVFENMDLSSMMTEFGEYTLIVSLVNSDNTQFAIPATDTVHFTYQSLYVAIETSETDLQFSETGESHTFDVSAFHLNETITLTVDNSAFTVSPSTLSATAENETVTVTFTGEASATGTLTLTSGTTTATVALNAVIPIDELIHSVGFEVAEGFTSTSTYNNTTPAYFGPEGQQWGTIHGTVMNGTTNNPAIAGSQSLQMRFYGSTSSATYGVMGYTYTNFDIHNVTKVEFDAKSTGGLLLRASFSYDGGETFGGDTVFTPSSDSQRFTYFITDSGQYYSVRVKFAVELPDEAPTSTVRLTIDAVDFYGVTGLEPNIVETPVISQPSGAYTEPITVSISCATEGASIYYTTDGTTPDQTSALYEGPITIANSCTLKAKAFKGGMDPSNAAFAQYSFPVEVATIADFKAAGANDNSTAYKITGDVTFVYRNARRIFIEDATGGLLVYDNNNPVVTGTYNEGDVISGGIIGTYTVYNGMQELVPTADWAEASGTTEITSIVATTADITGDFATYEARLVRVNGGTFAEEASFNTSDYTEYALTDESGEIVVRNQFKTLDTVVNAGDTVDVIGLAAIYVTGGNTTYQIFPRTNADIIPLVTEPADTTNPDDTVSIHTFVPVILSVYPNPATDNITVSADQNGGSLEVLNAFGQVVYRCISPVYPMEISLSDKAAGLYFVRVITADQRIAVVKVTKE